MITDEVATNGLAALSVAAVMLIEDAIDVLSVPITTLNAGDRQGALAALGADLTALAAATSVLARHRIRAF